jgi:hypothetical protein
MANQPLMNSAVNPSKIRRFRSNPVEVAIFSVITLIFFNSVYNLFWDQQGFHPAALAPMVANPISESGGRSPASASQAFVNVDVKCDTNADQDTTATKVRMTGTLCGDGRAPASDGSKLVKTMVVNNANKFNATVFTDVNAGKFSTDYIPLNLGKNPIHLEFTYRDGKVISQDINVVKN